jgi:3-methylcrotonyl-CoA carboxylase alpha subunit
MATRSKLGFMLRIQKSTFLINLSNFLPDTGVLKHLSPPIPSDTVRIETGVRQGDLVSVYYDPMIAKLVVWGKDRSSALKQLCKSLSEYQVLFINSFILRLWVLPLTLNF